MVAVHLSKAVQYGLSTALAAKEQGNAASNRLGSGLAVRNALEDPTAYFSSQSLSANAASLDRILTRLTQGVQSVKAAENGLTAIAKQIDVAKGIGERAKATDNLFARASFASEYNTLLEKIADLARDSGYGDRNLLGGPGNDVKLYFSEDSSFAALINAVDYKDVATLGLSPIEAGDVNEARIPLSDGTDALGIDSLLLADSSNFALGDVIEVSDGATVIASVTVTSSTTVGDLVAGLSASDKGFRSRLADGELVFEAVGSFTISGGKVGGGLEQLEIVGQPTDWSEIAPIDDILESLVAARKTVESQTATFAADLAMLQSRLTFMTDYASVLKLSAESTVAADPNEEAANVLALQLRQQLATTSLSLSRTVDESILRMLG